MKTTQTTCHVFALLAALQAPSDVMSADLKPETVQAFDRYVHLTQARFEREVKRPGAFLHFEGLPEPQRSAKLRALRGGDILMEKLQERDAAGRAIDCPDGMIHHWLGAVFINGAKVQDVINLVEDYDSHENIYKPEVVRSKLLSRSGDDFKIYYRLRKHKVITVTFNTLHDAHYTRLDNARWFSHSTATRIAEVDDADTPNEREKPVGQDHGFLWRLDSWWRFEEKDGGVYVESESVSLTRDIPWVVGPVVRPFVTEIPRESLRMTMGSTRTAVLERIAARKGNANAR